jgi:hypothetical protein
MHPVAALLPLETLPSWPSAPDPSVMQMLTLTVFIPLIIAAVVTLFVLGPGWRAKSE